MQQNCCPLFCVDEENLNNIIFDLKRGKNSGKENRCRTEINFIDNSLAGTSRNHRLEYINKHSSLIE